MTDLEDEIRTELIAQSLRDHDRRRRLRLRLAPCSPEEDYDRFERWSSGFHMRVKSPYPRIGYHQDCMDGWTTCDRLLCPEKYNRD